MIRNQAGAIDASGKVNLFCVTCGQRTQRVYNEERQGFGRCRCGGELRRAGALAAERRAAKAKRELEGGPAR